MKCPVSGAAELLHEPRDIVYACKGQTSTIPTMTGDYCPAGGEAGFDAAESAHTGALMQEFNRQVNAAMVDPQFYRVELSISGFHSLDGAPHQTRQGDAKAQQQQDQDRLGALIECRQQQFLVFMIQMRRIRHHHQMQHGLVDVTA